MSKNKNDIFGNRMKEYEQVEAGRKSLRYLPVCVRLDGNGFCLKYNREIKLKENKND